MKKIIATVLAIAAISISGFAQSPDLVKFIIEVENNFNDNIHILESGDNALMEGLFMDVISIYERQSVAVKEEAKPWIAPMWYNVACMRALQDNTDEALEAFATAIDMGWNDYVHTMNDPDLLSLHDNQRFKDLANKIK